jgi:myo-inositol 2-dehydrogenase / D-chiro-inositol 1-dehydrogenase
MTIRVGVIGTGAMGTDHARKLAASVGGATVSAVADVDRDRADAVAHEVGARVAGNGLDLIASDDVDAVLIASTVETHLEFTLAAVEAGKPVLCEKPLAATAEEALRVVAAETTLGRRLVVVGFMRRADPAYLAAKATLDADGIGEPLLLHNIHRNPSVAPWFTRAMTMTDSIVHEIDVTRWLLGEEIVAVDVIPPKRSAAAPRDLQDPQFAAFTTTSGVLSTVEFFGSAGYGYDVRCELVGTTGTATVDAGVAPDFRVRFAAAYQAELDTWIAGLERREIVGPSAWDGYAATRVAEAAVEAASTGRRVEIEPSRPPEVYRQPGD